MPALDNLTDSQLIPAIIDALSKRKDCDKIREALIVMLLNRQSVTMLGQEVQNCLQPVPAEMRSYYVYPYPRMAATTLAIIIALDEYDRPHLLLGQKQERSDMGHIQV